MRKNPIRFIKKINAVANSYFTNREKNQKENKKILREMKKIQKNTNHLKEEIKILKKENKTANEKIEEIKFNYLSSKSEYRRKYDTIEAYLKKIFNEFEMDQKYCPICEKSSYVFLPFGINPRDNAMCPHCGSLERHRQIYLYFKNETNIFKENIKLLHFAPELIFHKIFSESENIDYWPVDLFRNDSNIKENVDMQNIPYEDNSFDIIFNSHILEHVPDDKKAIEELYRVIKPQSKRGIVVTMVPIDYNLDETFEKEEYNTPELRLKYYGQDDHVRIYGKDFLKRLKSVGFHVEIYKPENLLEKNIIEKYGLLNEEIFICRK